MGRRSMPVNAKKLEAAVRTNLANFRMLLKQGKGQWGHPGYVRDSTWHGWLTVVATLEDILAAADDGKEQH